MYLCGGGHINQSFLNPVPIRDADAMTRKTTLVLGIGNTLLTDEGIGVHVIEHLRRTQPALPGVEYLDGGTLSFALAGQIEDADNLIVIDAAQLHAAPGSVRCFVDADMDRFLGSGKRSAHEVGLIDLLHMAGLAERLPVRRALIGIQPATIDWGDTPSAGVAQAIPAAARLALQLIETWTEGEA